MDKYLFVAFRLALHAVEASNRDPMNLEIMRLLRNYIAAFARRSMYSLKVASKKVSVACVRVFRRAHIGRIPTFS
jgi:hypothetical protein